MEDLRQEGGGPARDHGDQREGDGELGQQVRHAGERPRLPRVLHNGRQRPVEVEEQRTVRRLGRQRLQQGRQARRGVAVRGQGQEDAMVVVVVVARSEPMTTTTSTPVTPVTGVDVVSGSTWAGLTPMALAMDAACCCWPVS